MAKLKKRELLDFIGRVEDKAINSVNTRYNKQLKEAKDVLMQEKGYTDRIALIQNKANELHVLLSGLMADVREDKELKYDSYYSVISGLNDHTGTKTMYNNILRNCKFGNRTIDTIKAERDKELAAVRANYAKVDAVCRTMTSAARIAEYLEGLGFDLSSIKKQADVALTTPIDTTKLFVCGENK